MRIFSTVDIEELRAEAMEEMAEADRKRREKDAQVSSAFSEN